VPAEALAILAKDQSVDIRLEVARNLNADKSTLERLSQDAQPEVAQTALVGLQRLAEE
jgi:hypothetical protein